MCGNDVRPICVVWSDKDGENIVGLGGLHRLLALNPALGLDVLRGLKEWEHGPCASICGALFLRLFLVLLPISLANTLTSTSISPISIPIFLQQSPPHLPQSPQFLHQLAQL